MESRLCGMFTNILRRGLLPYRVKGKSALLFESSLSGASYRKFWSDSKESKDDKKKRKEEVRKKLKEDRKEIISEIKSGYFKDFGDFKKHEGKHFVAADTILPREMSKKFPILQCVNLAEKKVVLPESCAGHVTLVLASLRAVGQEMTESYRLPFLREFGNNSKVLCFEVNVIEGWLMNLIRNQIISNLRKVITSDKRKDTYFCYFGSSPELRKNFIQNVYVGHAYLLDRHGYVRWSAHGKPVESELEHMKNCTIQLLR